MRFEIAMGLISAGMFAVIVVCFLCHNWFEKQNAWLLWLVQGLLTSAILICQAIGLLAALYAGSWLSALFFLGFVVSMVVSYFEYNLASAGSGDDLPGAIRKLWHQPKNQPAAATYADRLVIYPHPEHDGPWK